VGLPAERSAAARLGHVHELKVVCYPWQLSELAPSPEADGQCIVPQVEGFGALDVVEPAAGVAAPAVESDVEVAAAAAGMGLGWHSGWKLATAQF
jgi:hypothetical protein